jgi:TolB-like protein/class 3 adenylate cyclase/Flp pilus assembly protein TadD
MAVVTYRRPGNPGLASVGASPADGGGEPRLRRKLTTILSADVAGYSRLTERDEEGTHRRLAALHHELLEPAIGAHGGTLIKRTGDGLLAEFASVVEALRYAIEVQHGAAERNAGFPPDRHILLRIGINLGDVIVEEGDIFGEGVNVAVRLESLAEPGGIVVSQAVREHIRGKLRLRLEDMGEQLVRNIVRPIRAFRVRAANQSRPLARHRRRWIVSAAIAATIALIAGLWWSLPSGRLPSLASTLSRVSWEPGAEHVPAAQRLSIVVLPFVNLSGETQEDYFADGITESLTTDLSRALPGSFVVARGTAFTYKGKSVDPRQVSRDLHVRYLLLGSVTTEGDRVRVNAQLLDAEANTELWAERFDRQRRDVLDIQDQIVGRLSRAVGLQLVDIEARRSERERMSNPTAIDLVMRGQSMINRPASRETMIAGRGMFQQALAVDPDNVDALAGIATTYVFEVLNGYYQDGRAERLRDAKALVQRALALEPHHIVALKANAALLRADGLFEDAIAASQVVIAQNPGEPWAYKEVGLSELYLGRFEEALAWFEKADQIGPRDPSRWTWLEPIGRVQFFLGRDEEAIRFFKLTVDANPTDVRAYALLAAVYASSGHPVEAAAALADCLHRRPEMTIERFFSDWSVPLQATSLDYRRQHARFRQGLRLAGMAES